MNNIFISVIIPVYNAEKYLDDCIASVVNQSYKHIEIIIINDGSTDNSEEIIRKWKYKDKRIIYLKQDNQGVAATRNRGISISKGEYLYFIDADDRIKLDGIETLVDNAVKTSSDIVIGNYYRVIGNKLLKSVDLRNQVLSPQDLIKVQTKAAMFLTQGRPLASACNKLYRLRFVKKFRLKFLDDIFAEDRLFNLMCYVNMPRITIINEYTYFYNIIDNSRSRKFSERFFCECISLFHVFNEYLKDNLIKEENNDLLQLIAIYELDNILNYYYTHLGGLGSLQEGLRLIKSNKLLHNTLERVKKENILKRITLKKMYFIRMNTLLTLYLNMPITVTAMFYWIFKKIVEVKRLFD